MKIETVNETVMRKKSIITLIVALWFHMVVFIPVAMANNIFQSVLFTPDPFDVTTGITLDPMLESGFIDATLEYRWILNGEEVLHEISEHFPGSQLGRGDQLSIEITPVLPGGERLPAFISQPLEVGNAIPKITSNPSSAYTDEGYSYQVTAIDPDGDVLNYLLEQAPVGMEIDHQTGKITWPFDNMPSGVYRVQIIVVDGYGGKGAQSFPLTLTSDQ